MITTSWENRNTIVAHLLNPAFCGEILRTAVQSYNKNSNSKFPFLFTFIILPILLHNDTRKKMPRSTRTYLFSWVEENDELFFDFGNRTKSLVKYTKEAVMFLLLYKKIELTSNGELIASTISRKKNEDEDFEEYNDIMKKAEMLGKWLSMTNDVKSIYSFFRITP